MGRFETEWLTTEANLAALSESSGVWIDRAHDRRPPKTIILDTGRSVSPDLRRAKGDGRAEPPGNGPGVAAPDAAEGSAGKPGLSAIAMCRSHMLPT